MGAVAAAGALNRLRPGPKDASQCGKWSHRDVREGRHSQPVQLFLRHGPDTGKPSYRQRAEERELGARGHEPHAARLRETAGDFCDGAAGRDAGARGQADSRFNLVRELAYDALDGEVLAGITASCVEALAPG